MFTADEDVESERGDSDLDWSSDFDVDAIIN